MEIQRELTSDELFKKLGYDKIEFNKGLSVGYVAYVIQRENYKSKIEFDLTFKSFNKMEYIFTPYDKESWSTQEFENDWLKHSARQGKWNTLWNNITIDELRAINKKVEELGWN